MQRRTYLAAVAGATVSLAGCLETLRTGTGGRNPTESAGAADATEDDAAAGEGTDTETEDASGSQTVVAETVVGDLEVPWGMAFREGTLYLTERPGRVVRVEDGEAEVVADLTDSTGARSEGGLLGLVFHPDDPDVAFSYQTIGERGDSENRIIRLDVADDWSFEPIFEGISAEHIHDGGRLLVHPEEEALYATVGDNGVDEWAQDTSVLPGSVLRLTLDGDPHPDNPEGDAVFSYGHRNPQGLALRDGDLYATEHGPDTDDEVNRLVAGGNYGWPEVRGEERGDDGQYVPALASYTPPIAPGGLALYPDDGPIEAWRGDFFFGTLVGTHLHRIRLDDDDAVTLDERLYEGEFGRLRTTAVGPDGHLYAATSNRDGRGDPADGDDRIVRFRPE